MTNFWKTENHIFTTEDEVVHVPYHGTMTQEQFKVIQIGDDIKDLVCYIKPQPTTLENLEEGVYFLHLEHGIEVLQVE